MWPNVHPKRYKKPHRGSHVLVTILVAQFLVISSPSFLKTARSWSLEAATQNTLPQNDLCGVLSGTLNPSTILYLLYSPSTWKPTNSKARPPAKTTHHTLQWAHTSFHLPKWFGRQRGTTQQQWCRAPCWEALPVSVLIDVLPHLCCGICSLKVIIIFILYCYLFQ